MPGFINITGPTAAEEAAPRRMGLVFALSKTISPQNVFSLLVLQFQITTAMFIL
jgi:hypothetical protein